MNEQVVGLRRQGVAQQVLPEGLPATPHTLRYGWRLRVGMIIPAMASNSEAHITAMLPEGVTLHTTRLKMDEKDAKSMLNFIDKVEDAAEMLKEAGVGSRAGELHGGDDGRSVDRRAYSPAHSDRNRAAVEHHR